MIFSVLGEKGKMPRLIDADKLMDYINGSIEEMTKVGVAVDGKYLWELINYAIENAPTVDAIPVIRCKDCESWGLNAVKKDEKGEVIYGDCLHFCVATPKWFYCAWGEKKEDA